MPDISVIIPAYNRAGLIGATLRSLLNQTLPAKEIIVVDDGSTDGTAEKTLEAFENWKLETGNLKKDDGEPFSGNSKSNIPNPTFKILRQANAGPGAARNRGLAEATGEFIHFFDSDDIAAPNKHEVQLRALLETDADIAYGPWVKGRFAPKEAQTVARPLAHGVARGSLPLAAQTARVAGATEATVLSVASFNSGKTRYQLPATAPEVSLLDARRSTLDADPGNFVSEGPVLQARGLPEGDLVKALLTNWSIVPHACLFRRSILEKAGGFPEDIWVGEDQLLFLRCLLAGAKVVHAPRTMVYYRVGDDPGKLTATGAPQKRHARDWGRFMLKANQEVPSGQCRVVGKRTCLTTECTESTEGGQGDAQGTCAGPSEPDSLTSKLADLPFSESLTRSASGPASLPATSHSLLATAPDALTTPSAWFGFRLRAYEAWRDLERFFPDGETELKKELQGIWKKNWFSGFRFQVSGFVLRKLAGLKLRVLGYREHASFRCGKFSSFIDFGGQ